MNVYVFEELKEGLEESILKKISEEDVQNFAKLSGDLNPLHTDENYAQTTKMGKKVVYGLLVQSYISNLVGMKLPGKFALILSISSKFKKPVFEGDSLKIIGKIVKKIPATKIIIVGTKITNQHNQIVLEGEVQVKLLS